MTTFTFTIPEEEVESFTVTRKSDAVGLFHVALTHRFGAARDIHGSIINPQPIGRGYGVELQDAVDNAMNNLRDEVAEACARQGERPRPSLPPALAKKDLDDLLSIVGL